MTSNFHPKQSVPNSHSAGSKPQSAPAAYSPSVPMSLYRELAAELQATKVMLDSLNSQNQQLSQQNQQLRREIDSVVHSALHLQQVADSVAPGNWNQPSYSHPELRTEPSRVANEQRPTPAPRRVRQGSGTHSSMSGMEVSTPFQNLEPTGAIFQEKLVVEVPEGRHRRRSVPEKSSEMNGWWFTLAVVVLVVTAFGAGYLVMRPMLPKR
ncbi:MAG TPA: hypothetical protein V6D28_24555 [Leptolyngbyaceae cyanobacterium]